MQALITIEHINDRGFAFGRSHHDAQQVFIAPQIVDVLNVQLDEVYDAKYRHVEGRELPRVISMTPSEVSDDPDVGFDQETYYLALTELREARNAARNSAKKADEALDTLIDLFGRPDGWRHTELDQ